jgi:hypothetical protein
MPQLDAGKDFSLFHNVQYFIGLKQPKREAGPIINNA